MKRFFVKGLTATILVVALALPPVTSVFATSALAATNPSGTGQPSQTCTSSTAPNEPGSSSSSPGSPFNEPNSGAPGTGTGGTVYAGQQPQNSKNPNSVSQYDVACYQVSQSHP